MGPDVGGCGLLLYRGWFSFFRRLLMHTGFRIRRVELVSWCSTCGVPDYDWLEAAGLGIGSMRAMGTGIPCRMMIGCCS
jgi:hypothetical protein